MEDMKETLLGLFTEIAILEHLVRVREERYATGDLTTGQFGVLNYFVLNHPYPDSIAGIAWCFQEEEDYTRSKIQLLADRGLVTVTPVSGSNDQAMVMITDAGREMHGNVVANIGPDIEMAVAEIPQPDLETTLRTLRNIRLTLDNLPDR
jgi:DNA-binding MarR family transcriptional regulator